MKFFFKRILPNQESMARSRLMRWALTRIGNAYIWQVNRRSIAGGMATGVFFGTLPIPVQMICSLLVAGMLRLNAPVAVFSTLYSNPLTMPALFYANYRVGRWLFGGGAAAVSEAHFAEENIMRLGGQILMPLFSGSVVVGLVMGCVSYVAVYLLWYWRLQRQLRSRGRWYAALKQRRLLCRNRKRNNGS